MTGISLTAESRVHFGGALAMATLGEIAEVNAAGRGVVEDRRNQERERKRLNQQKRRQQKATDAERKALAEAERQEREDRWRERVDEQLAPAILRSPIMSASPHVTGSVRYAGVAEEGAPMVFVPNGRTASARMLVGPRVQIIDGRPVRASDHITEDLLAPRNRPVELSDRQKRAVRALRLDWADVGEGVNSGAVDYLRAGGGGEGLGGHEAMLTQIATRARFEGAMAYVGAFAPGIARVVLDCIPLSVWRIETERSPEEALACMRAGLSRLADFYWPPREPGEAELKMLTFGPSRASYEVAPPDIERKKVTIDDWHGA